MPAEPAEWEEGSLARFVPEEIQDFAGAVGGVVGGVAAILNVAATALKAASFLLLATANPILALVDQLEKQITAFLSDLRTSGVYVLPVVPRSARFKMGTPEFITTVVDSLADTADSERPQFSASSNVVALVFLAGAPDLKTLYNNFAKALGELTDLGELKELKWTADPTAETEPEIFQDSALSRAVGKEPDWHSMTLQELFPPVGEALQALEEAIDGLFPGQDLHQFVSALATAMKQKAEDLQEVADRLKNLADALENFFDITGVWILDTGNVAGTDGFALALAESVNRPPFTKDEFFTAGVVLLAGGPGVAGFQALLGLS